MSFVEGLVPMHAHYLWVVAGLLLAVGEIVTTGFVLLWFSLGAFVAALSSALGASLDVQLTVFAVTSLALFAGSRTIFRKVLLRGSPEVATNVEAMIGKQAEVVAQIGPGLRAGTVKVGSETWDALADGAVVAPGSLVRVESIEGLKLRVRTIDELGGSGEAGREHR
jgi:membrane protein implicated in regulation of membrane protease activity